MDLSKTDLGTLQYQDMEMTPHPQCMPDKYKSTELRIHSNTVRAYRRYYVNDKKDIAKWEKGRPMPDWYDVGNDYYKMTEKELESFKP